MFNKSNSASYAEAFRTQFEGSRSAISFEKINDNFISCHLATADTIDDECGTECLSILSKKDCKALIELLTKVIAE